jgi:hypothetical protein
MNERTKKLLRLALDERTPEWEALAAFSKLRNNETLEEILNPKHSESNKIKTGVSNVPMRFYHAVIKGLYDQAETIGIKDAKVKLELSEGRPNSAAISNIVIECSGTEKQRKVLNQYIDGLIKTIDESDKGLKAEFDKMRSPEKPEKKIPEKNWKKGVFEGIFPTWN